MTKQNIFFITILSLFLISIGAIFFVDRATNREPAEVEQESIQKEKEELPQELEILQKGLQFEQTGIVEEIGSDFLIVRTHKEITPGVNKLTVLMIPETEIIKLILKRNPQEEGLEINDIIEENGSISDIKIGDMVIIVTNENVEGKTEVKALRVKVVKREF